MLVIWHADGRFTCWSSYALVLNRRARRTQFSDTRFTRSVPGGVSTKVQLPCSRYPRYPASAMAMAIPSLIVVMLSPIVPVEDLEP
jgi:hypothetical protein